MPAAMLLPLVAMSAQSAPGASTAETEQVRVELLSSVSHAYPGEEITLGLHQRIAPHWHTYWSNPGDSGVATKVAWTLPAGWQAGALQWPAPHYFQTADIGNYGYGDEVTLLTQVAIPRAARPGSVLPVQAEASWLVCKDICIPQRAKLVLNVPVAASGAARNVKQPLIELARAQLPVAAPWPITVTQSGRDIRLSWPAPSGLVVKEARFFAADWGKIDQHAPQRLSEAQNGQLSLSVPQGESPPGAGEALQGVLVLASSEGSPQGHSERLAYVVGPVTTPTPGASGLTPQAGTDAVTSHSAQKAGDAEQAEEGGATTLGLALLLALLGGLVLNLMPCVFPVLSIKALSLLRHSEVSPRRSRLHGLAYTAGVLSSFAALALALITLKAAGAQAGWGFQFQSPVFVLAVAYLMFAVGLNLSGVFTVGGTLGGVGGAWADKEGYTGSFFTGVLATVVATPCTAPFMGGAIGFALTQPPTALLAVFMALGMGLALPYLLLSSWPRLQRHLPRPGAWMERLKQGLAFPMYGTAAWLVWVLAQQAGINAVAVALAGMIALGFAAWVYEQTRHGAPLARRAGTVAAALVLGAALAGGRLGIDTSQALQQTAQQAAAPTGGMAAQAVASKGRPSPYQPDTFKTLRASGEPVFLNFTAAWCITCLVNERVALHQASVIAAFERTGTHYLKGDWTNQDAAITDMLRRFGRSGVPLYVYYPPGRDSEPVVLPQLLTPDVVLGALKDKPASVAHAD